MANTYIKIASVTVGAGGASSIDFTSIPSTYTDLNLVYSVRSSNASNSQLTIAINNTTANYSDKVLEGNGSNTFTFSNAGGTGTGVFGGSLIASTQTANTFNNGQIYISNYAGSTNKSMSIDYVTENNAALSYADLVAGLWSNTAAITSVKLTPASGSWQQYSSATLYGISKS